MDSIYSFTKLLKNCKCDMSDFPVFRLALLGDCATQHLAAALKGYAYTQNLSLDVFDADYDQVLPMVIDCHSEMYKFKPDAVLIFMCAEKLYDSWCVTPQSDRSSFAENVFLHIKEYWNYIASRSAARILQLTFVENDDLVFGNYALKHQESFIFQLRKLNLLLMDGCTGHKNVFLVDLCGIQARFGREKLFDHKLYCIAKMPISLAALPVVAASVVNVIRSLRGSVKKCAVLDLDNTLWGGVVGDDGLSGIQIGALGLGYAFSDFQEVRGD